MHLNHEAAHSPAAWWRASFTMNVTVAFGGAAIGVMEYVRDDRAVARAWLVGAAICGVAALLVAPLRRRRDLRVFVPAWFVSLGVMLGASWLTNDYLSAHAPTRELYAARTTALVVGLVAPPHVAVGIGSLLSFAVLAVAQYRHWSPEVQAQVGPLVPWQTLVFVAAGLCVYFFRVRAQRLEYRAARAEARAAALSHYARIVVAARDLIGTPMQTIDVGLAVLHARASGEARVLGRMDAALARLRHVSTLLNRHMAPARWEEGDDALDAEALLERSGDDLLDEPRPPPPAPPH